MNSTADVSEIKPIMENILMNQQNQKTEKFYLWWMDRNRQTRLPAGVAFYEEGYGEYRLKIDFLQALQEAQDLKFYLKSVGASDDRILFRAEAAVKKNGKFAGRYPVGEGYSSKATDGEIFIDFGPFEKALVLTLKN